MITYTYQCRNEDCNYRFEAMQRISDDPLCTCPACGEDSLERVVTASNFQLKGNGWFKTSGEY